MTTTIPASAIVSVTPNVIGAGGNGLDLIAVALTESARVPVGAVEPFPSAAAVAAYFGASSHEAAVAAVYFNGFDNSNVKPGSILFAQYNQNAVAAWLRGGAVSGLTLAQLQALSGDLTVVFDGASRTGSAISLAGANSFSAAAALIQTALNAALPTEVVFTGSIAASTASFTGSIAGTILTVSAVASGKLVPGSTLSGTGGGGIAAGTVIVAQLTGTANGVGTYAISPQPQTVASTAMTSSYGTLTVTAVASGTLAIGQTLSGSGVGAGTIVNSLGTGSGLLGTYYVGLSQTAPSAAMTALATAVAVAYDSVSGAFSVTSGVLGAASTAAYATGPLATGLLFTAALGAVISQGADPSTPGPFMTAIANVTQDWATFFLCFDPDRGVANGNSQKLAFALWAGQSNDRYAFICWTLDPSATLTVPANTCLGQLLAAAQASGTSVWYEPSDMYVAAFICGAIASIDFTETNGRSTLAFKSQSGLQAGVTNQTVAANLIANFENFYGAYGTANQGFVFAYPGSISGPFKWLDSYINQIWLNNAFQLALMELLTTVKSIPYNRAGYALIEAALMDPIQAGLNFGAFRAGVTLSFAQAAEVNSAAGVKISDTLSQRGWYLQVLDAAPIIRGVRGSPPCTFWYMDGESVQKINLTSVDVL